VSEFIENWDIPTEKEIEKYFLGDYKPKNHTYMCHLITTVVLSLLMIVGLLAIRYLPDEKYEIEGEELYQRNVSEAEREIFRLGQKEKRKKRIRGVHPAAIYKLNQEFDSKKRQLYYK